ncbi:nucleotidyltransferase [Viridibacillus sp. YIM B01967]|uniref:tRNA(Met) cytidine acetate ligase n=1 Tax=Viridibacillus soli TaxID=2798301 RepID=A0ABS1H822_9BACL|nr:nucleotidyltransferase [Viridibacillus soli]MBK3495449.1 nucleotidyltransferase [Viridibacillus soli]
MIATGVIVEYNPFHNGHLHHIRQSRKETNADIVIAVMSGHFLQRGEPAFVDKWTRTQMALASGADLVIELPYVYATAQASDFAKGGISLLEALNCDFFSFGSEEGSITPFLNSYSLLQEHNDTLQQLVRNSIQTGISYPQALNIAYKQLIPNNEQSFVDLSKPNNILGFHYIEAAYKIQANIKAVTIQRIKAGYHDAIGIDSSIASATGIRKAVFEEASIEGISSYMPQTSFKGLEEWQYTNASFGSWEAFWPLLRFTIIRHTPQELSTFAEVTEGIEYLLLSAAKNSENFANFMQQVKSKRYTWTRIQRMLTHIFTGFTWERLKSFEQPSYIRLLGMTENGQKYLSANKKEFTLPIISRVASSDDAMLMQDIQATDLYMLALNGPVNTKRMGLDYKTPPIRM